MKKIKLPPSYFNFISFLGTIIALIAWLAIIFLVIMDKIINAGNVYTELFTYLVVPGFLVFGLILISYGMYRKRRRNKKGIKTSDTKVLIINFSDRKTRNAILIFSFITTIFLLSTVIGSYQGFHYTESVEFCGKLCHKVMNPEYVAYQNSPHANVKCAECHVGEGVDWYVKSKMSGLRQVYKYMTNTYPRPIATPIENLRPARETCEKCHWPQKFYGNKLHHEKYFLADSTNTEWDIILNMKIGPSNESQGLSQGIHWHINPDIKMEYKANEKRDTIYWVKVRNLKTGKVTVFNNDDYRKSISDLNNVESRTMDCMDCHNRPSHEYRSPSYYVNKYLAYSSTSARIPWIKKAAMEALKVIYTTDDSASAGIKENMLSFYKDTYPSLYKQYGSKINIAITDITKKYSQNAFPEMKVTYSVYPRHIGHLESNGCFRCHDGRHKSSDGKVISKSCNLCHTIIAQGKIDSLKYTTLDKPADFIHPKDIGRVWKESNCEDCHKQLY